MDFQLFGGILNLLVQSLGGQTSCTLSSLRLNSENILIEITK